MKFFYQIKKQFQEKRSMELFFKENDFVPSVYDWEDKAVLALCKSFGARKIFAQLQCIYTIHEDINSDIIFVEIESYLNALDWTTGIMRGVWRDMIERMPKVLYTNIYGKTFVRTILGDWMV